MDKREIAEIKKLFKMSDCCLTKICGCYVSHEKEKIMVSKNTFLSLPEEEEFKYLDIFKKTLSGKIGKNLYKHLAEYHAHRILRMSVDECG